MVDEWRKELELVLTIAKNATNGWACYAKRQIEHDEIARLHSAIAESERRLSSLPPVRAEEPGYRTRDAIRDRHKAGESVASLAKDYALPQAFVAQVVAEPVRAEEPTEATTIHLPDAVSLKMLENENAILRRRLDECRPYLKDGESPAQCIARNRADVDLALGLLAKEKQKNEAAAAPVRETKIGDGLLRGGCLWSDGRMVPDADMRRRCGCGSCQAPVRETAAEPRQMAACNHCGWISRAVICRCGRERDSGILPLDSPLRERTTAPEAAAPSAGPDLRERVEQLDKYFSLPHGWSVKLADVLAIVTHLEK